MNMHIGSLTDTVTNEECFEEPEQIANYTKLSNIRSYLS